MGPARGRRWMNGYFCVIRSHHKEYKYFFCFLATGKVNAFVVPSPMTAMWVGRNCQQPNVLEQMEPAGQGFRLIGFCGPRRRSIHPSRFPRY